MGKRSDFKRRKNDLYETWDARAVAPLLFHVPQGATFDEPCAGGGALSDQLIDAGLQPRFLSDIDPIRDGIEARDAFDYNPLERPDYIITNPPWTRDILHPLILHFSDIAPTWLLFDAAWMFTAGKLMHRRGFGSVPAIMERCVKVVTVGRLKWIRGSSCDAKDDCAWYLFDAAHDGRPPEFYPKAFMKHDFKEGACTQ